MCCLSVIYGSDGTPAVANKTVTRSKSIIPGKGVTLNLDQVGTGILANDIGIAIVGYRLDLYKGSGKAVCSNFNNMMAVGACNPAISACPATTVR